MNRSLPFLTKQQEVLGSELCLPGASHSRHFFSLFAGFALKEWFDFLSNYRWTLGAPSLPLEEACEEDHSAQTRTLLPGHQGTRLPVQAFILNPVYIPQVGHFLSLGPSFLPCEIKALDLMGPSGFQIL